VFLQAAGGLPSSASPSQQKTSAAAAPGYRSNPCRLHAMAAAQTNTDLQL